jgi:hypothetical protein
MTSAGVSTAAAQAHDQVTICHRTGSATNPYIKNSPDIESIVNGHIYHVQTGSGLGGDIIPVITYKGVTYSKNLDTDFGHGLTGRMILDNGCVVPGMMTITLEIVPCHPGQLLPRVRFVGQLTGLTFFLNGQQVYPDANGEVEVQPGQYHWEVFDNGELIASGDVTVIDCAIGTPTPSPSPTPPPWTPSPSPTPVPEPGTLLLLGTGLAVGIFAFRKFGMRS